MRKIKTILLLAAGDGTRFWPLKNKVGLSFLGKSLLEHQISELSKWAEKIIVVTNSENSNAVSGVEQVVQANLDEGQAGAVLAAQGKVEGEVLILNANDVFDYSIIEKIAESGDDFVFLAKKVSQYFPGGYVRFENEKVAEIVEKPDPDKVPSDIVKLVVDYCRNYSQLVKALEATKSDGDDWYERGLSKLIESSEKVSHILYEDEWQTIKYPWQVLGMMKYFLSKVQAKKEEGVVISDKALIVGDVYLGKNVKVGDFAKIVGPCYIGENTIIGDFTMVRESHIGNNSLVGGYSEVTRSYLGNNVMLHRDYVGDSVYGDDVLMGADAVTANFRFDQKTVQSPVKGKKVDSNLQKFGAIVGTGAKIGVHTTLAPGVKVGVDTFIGPHSFVDKDLEDNKFFHKGELIDKK